MEPIRAPDVLAKMQAVFELYQTAEDIMHQNLRRRFSNESDAEIERRLLMWLRKANPVPDSGASELNE
jgi:hypothetical protein